MLHRYVNVTKVDIDLKIVVLFASESNRKKFLKSITNCKCAWNGFSEINF